MRAKCAIMVLVLVLLLALAPAQSFAQQAREMALTPTNDAYVVANLNDPFDQLGLRTLNTGTLTFLKAWYAWNVTQAGTDKIVSLVYLKFDLASLSAESISSVKLELYAFKVNLTGASRAVSVYSVPNNNWSETTITFNNAPGFDNKTFVQTYVSLPGRYYTFDVTSIAKKQIHSQLSLMVALAVLYEHNEEQVIFNSKEAVSNQPKLVVDYIGPPLSTLDYLSQFFSTMPGILILPAAIGGGGVGGFFVLKRTRVLRRRKKDKLPSKTRRSTPSQTLPPTPTRTVVGRFTKTAEPTAGRKVVEKGACPNCGKAVEPEFKLCPECGFKLARDTCPSCGQKLKPEFKLCPYCGTKLP